MSKFWSVLERDSSRAGFAEARGQT